MPHLSWNAHKKTQTQTHSDSHTHLIPTETYLKANVNLYDQISWFKLKKYIWSWYRIRRMKVLSKKLKLKMWEAESPSKHARGARTAKWRNKKTIKYKHEVKHSWRKEEWLSCKYLYETIETHNCTKAICTLFLCTHFQEVKVICAKIPDKVRYIQIFAKVIVCIVLSGI